MSRSLLSPLVSFSTFIGLLIPWVAHAQPQARSSTAADLARQFAPMYWFAIDEPLYPTLPHPFAFDGVQIDKTNPCRLSLDKTGIGQPDFFNVMELTLDETCNRVALKRRFRPLLQGMPQGAPEIFDELSPHPRMRILYDGPRYFSGGVNITTHKSIVCESAGAPQPLIRQLRDFFALPEHETGAPDDSQQKPSLKDIKADAASGLCSGTFTVRQLGVGRLEYEQPVKFKVRPVWWDDCRKVFVLKKPEDRCDPKAALMAFAGPEALESEDGIVLRPRYVIQYWSYFPYDRGINGHRHDGEHTFVFVEGFHAEPPSLDAPVVGIVGGGHEEESANNILVSGGLDVSAPVVDQIAFPESLPRHPMVLVELGKHASAPDRNLNGRYDIGVDANLWGENSWGSRDTQSALFGKAQLGKMQPWYSMPRSPDGVFTEQDAWIDAGTRLDTDSYRIGYPHGVFAEFADRLNKEIPRVRAQMTSQGRCDFGPARTYRLMPISTLKGLNETIKSSRSSGASGWSNVRRFLEDHKDEFWEERCTPELPAATDMERGGEIMTALQGWADINEKRDVWDHRKFKKPDTVFKTHLFPRTSVGWSLRSFSGEFQHLALIQLADLGPTLHLHDSTLEIAFRAWDREPGLKTTFKTFLPHVAVTIENFRGRYRGWYSGVSVDSLADARRRWNFRAGYEIQFATLQTVPLLGGLIFQKLPAPGVWQRVKVAVRLGGRGLLWGGRALDITKPKVEYHPFAFEWGLNLSFAVKTSKHPLKFYSDRGKEPNEERR
jgi:hypothetical protein